MTDQTKIDAKAAAEAPAKVAETVAKTAETIATESAKTAKRARATNARRAQRQAAAQKTAQKTTARRAKSTARKTRTAARKTATATRKTTTAAQERIETVTNSNFFNGFTAVPAFAPFQSMFADANGRGQDMAQRGQKVAEELANLARANVEAMVEAGRVAAQGARALSHDAAGTGRDGFEQAADAIRTLAEAKSPTEYLQRQSDIARASFDRVVAQTSRMTENMVKLAGEAFQPLSNRASANAERFNTLVA